MIVSDCRNAKKKKYSGTLYHHVLSFLCILVSLQPSSFQTANHHPNPGVVCQGVPTPPKMYLSLPPWGLPSSCFLLPCHSSPNIPHIPHIPQCLQFLTKTTHGFFLGGFLFIILLMPGFGVGPSFQRFNSCLNVFSFVLHQILGHLVLFFVARKNARAVLPFLLLGRVVQPHETQQQVVV